MESSRIKLKKYEIRQLSKREKVLISLLIIIMLIWAIYKLAITPQIEKLNEIRDKKIEYQNKILEFNKILRRENEIKKEWEELNNERQEILSKYFPTLDQSQIIYLLSALAADENIIISDYNFSRKEFEEFGDFQVKNISVAMPYSGDYNGVINFISSLKNNQRKILIENLTMDKVNKEEINGIISLKIYCLDGVTETENKVSYIEVPQIKKNNPFSGFDNSSLDKGTDEVEVEEKVNEKLEIKPYIEKILLDFEVMNNYFIPSHPLTKGNLNLSKNAKSNRYSLRIEYKIVAVEEESRAFIDVSKNNLLLKYPPNSIGLWVYSFDYSPVTIGLELKGQMGEEIYIPFTEGVGWTGWKYVELSPPYDINIYPLKIEKLYLELPYGREDMGVFLFDKLEASYNRNIDDEGNDASLSVDYFYHEVEPGETIYSISVKYYGTKNYANEIMQLNDIQEAEELKEGKILVLRKR